MSLLLTQIYDTITIFHVTNLLFLRGFAYIVGIDFYNFHNYFLFIYILGQNKIRENWIEIGSELWILEQDICKVLYFTAFCV